MQRVKLLVMPHFGSDGGHIFSILAFIIALSRCHLSQILYKKLSRASKLPKTYLLHRIKESAVSHFDEILPSCISTIIFYGWMGYLLASGTAE